MAPLTTGIAHLVAAFFSEKQRRGVLAVSQGLTATGGVISDYPSGGNVYRAHVFTSSGALTVSALGNLGNTVE